MIKIVEFDKKSFLLLEILQDHFSTKNLDTLHNGLNYKLFTMKEDQSSSIHKKFYEIYNTNTFLNEYKKLLKEFIKPLYNEAIVYQQKPTFRIHMPNNVAVGEYHKDRDYSHCTKELNYWLPFTKAFGTNTIWIESEEDKGDYKPYELEYGQILVFDGANLSHGNKTNTTNVSRVNIDFRVMPISLYNETEQSLKSSTHLKLPMTIGNYYEKI